MLSPSRAAQRERSAANSLNVAMSPVRTDRLARKLRRQALDLLLELEATVCVACPFDRAAKAQLDATREQIRIATKKQLRSAIARGAEQIRALRNRFEVTAPGPALVKLFHAISAVSEGHSTYVPVHAMRELFADYSKVMRGSEHFPAHARVAVDVSGTLYDTTRHPEVFLLEASMFEDMAALFNLVASDRGGGRDQPRPKSEIKTRSALHRAVILAALHFVEAYVNGVALEYVLTKGSALDDRTKDVLSDWDSSRSRPKYLSLGDKVLQYQRIVLGVEHAPLQESNCPEMATILKVAKRVRDALAHPSAAADPSTFRPEKELAIATLGFEDVAQAVDAAVALVRRLGITLYGEHALLWWLYDRTTDGTFPAAAFQ